MLNNNNLNKTLKHNTGRLSSNVSKTCTTFGQVNLGKRKAACAEANTRKYDVLLVTEPSTAFGKVTGLEPSKDVHSTSKATPRACIKTGLKAWLLEEFTDMDMATVSLVGVDGGEDLVVSSIYLDIALPVEKALWAGLIRWCDTNRRPLVMGIDSNAHSEMWGSLDLNARGEILEEFIMGNNLTILNRGRVPTFTGGGGTVIDITLSNIWFERASSIQEWEVDMAESMSDHRYITFQLGLDLQHPVCPSRNIRKADWTTFKARLSAPPRWGKDTDDLASALDDAAQKFQSAIEGGMPKKAARRSHHKQVVDRHPSNS